jgi:hypothetical protein
LINLTPSEMPKIFPFTDCDDLHLALTSPAQPTPANKTLVIYLSAIRDDIQSGRIAGTCWCDTHDMMANVGTKLETDGTLPICGYVEMYQHCKWAPSAKWKLTTTIMDGVGKAGTSGRTDAQLAQAKSKARTYEKTDVSTSMLMEIPWIGYEDLSFEEEFQDEIDIPWIGYGEEYDHD